ncbi:MAG TPA: hypothetical protein VJG90_08505 [Candidatus Nanoarchaeia archaeon]|nr:hypothetical protein [Candidatus Nanoarchaeia archaeon]
MATFPLENIVTMSARDWCETQGVRLSDYQPIGIHHCGQEQYPLGMESFANQAPKGTIIITDFHSSMTDTRIGNPSYEAHGTALVLKS